MKPIFLCDGIQGKPKHRPQKQDMFIEYSNDIESIISNIETTCIDAIYDIYRI